MTHILVLLLCLDLRLFMLTRPRVVISLTYKNYSASIVYFSAASGAISIFFSDSRVQLEIHGDVVAQYLCLALYNYRLQLESTFG